MQCGGLNILTDPVFSERASPLPFAGPKRAQPPGMALDELPAIDVVVISHNHYDHLDRASVVRLNERGQGRTLDRHADTLWRSLAAQSGPRRHPYR